VFAPDLVYGFWTIFPDKREGDMRKGLDVQNLKLSGLKRWQLVFEVAPDEVLGLLQELGIESVCVRMREDQYMTPQARAGSFARLRAMVRRYPFVHRVWFGVEPDANRPGSNPPQRYDLRYGSETWGGDHPDLVRNAIFAFLKLIEEDKKADREAKRPVLLERVQTVSSALMYRGHYKDWNNRGDPGGGLQPGVRYWIEVMRLALDACSLNGFHWYGADGTDYDFFERMRVSLW
jgi:hypothetical protein